MCHHTLLLVGQHRGHHTVLKYYAMNCLKAGIRIILCGWLDNENLWGGAVTDSDYDIKAGYLEEQKRHQESDLVMGAVIEFLNLLDRGFRGKMTSWKCGHQVALQLPSAKSGQRFTGSKTVFVGSIVHDRDGNERAVRVCKLNGLIKCGLLPGMSATRLDNAWRACGFWASKIWL